MLEYNVRSASIIGYVGAGGIGLHLKLYAESADSWNKFSLVLIYAYHRNLSRPNRRKSQKIHSR